MEVHFWRTKTRVLFVTGLSLFLVSTAAHAQYGVGALDEQVAEIPPAAAADTKFNVLAAAAFTLAGIESEVGDEFLRPLKAADVANDGQQAEGVDLPNA